MEFRINNNNRQELYIKERAVSKGSIDKTQSILNAMKQDPKVTAAKRALYIGISSRAVEKRIRTLQESGKIRRIGPDKGGFGKLPICRSIIISNF